MNKHNVEQLILRMENYLECWKQFNLYVNLARDKKFTPEDEAQFLDLKSLITQGSESISAAEVKGGACRVSLCCRGRRKISAPPRRSRPVISIPA